MSAHAFPTQIRGDQRDADIMGNVPAGWDGGMSLRDYFAAAAMTGLLSSPRLNFGASEVSSSVVAKDCYRIADTMLEARNL